MNRATKQKIRRLWRCRLLMSVGALTVAGCTLLQVQNVLKYRSTYPAWSLELAQELEILSNEGSSNEEKGQALLEIQIIARQHQLPITETIIQESLRLSELWEGGMDLDRAMARVLYLNQELEEMPDQDQAQDLAQELMQVMARYRALVQEARYLDLSDSDRNWGVDSVLNLTSAHEKDSHQKLKLAQRVTLAQADDLAQALVRVINQDQELNRALDLVNKLDLELDLELDWSISQESIKALEVELHETYGLTLLRSDELQRVLDHEPDRARVFLLSAVLLGILLFGLASFLIILTRTRVSYSIPMTAHLVAFLPEAWVGELGALQRRMKKQNASVWEIRRRLLEEFVTLLWVFYIQVQLENLWLPSGDREIDE